jgi:DNA-binding MarR family transcriptional regulator
VTETTSLGNALLRSAARLSRWASRHASFDVPFAQARLLALLDELGPSRVSALSAADHSSQPSITTQLHRLEAAGWVERAVDPDDARASLVSLTQAGKDALEGVRRARVAVLAPALDGLDGPALARLQVAIDVLDELLAAAAEPPISHPTRKDG